MSELGSIKSIKSLVKDTRIEGDKLHVIFEATPMEGEIEAVVPARISDAQREDEPFFFNAIRAANDVVRDLAGYTASVSAAAVAVDSAIDRAEGDNPAKPAAPLSEEALDDALYRSFSRVMDLLVWVHRAQEWVIIDDAQGLRAELQRQLKLAPLESYEDRHLMVRMLLDVATVDGKLNEPEQEALLDFVDKSQATGNRPGERGRVSQNDLRMAAAGASRETLYMLACAIAMIDHKFNPAESDRLDFYAKGLGIDEHRADELLEAGQMFFIEQYMTRRFAGLGELGEEDRDKIIALAEHLHYDTDSAEYAFERYQRVHSKDGGETVGGGSACWRGVQP